MKIESLSIRTPAVKRPIASITDGPAYKAWQARWQDHRPPTWEWSTSPQAMAVEAVEALSTDLLDQDADAAPDTVIRLLAALSMELPADRRAWDWTIPLNGVDQPAVLHLSLALRPAAPEEDDAPAVGMSLVAQTEHDRKRLADLGVLEASRPVPTDTALAFLDEAAKAAHPVQVSPSLAQWDASALHAALVEGQERWPHLSSPLQAIPVVAGWVIWQRAVRLNATESELILRGITYGMAPDEPAHDAFLKLTHQRVDLVPERRVRPRSPR